MTNQGPLAGIFWRSPLALHKRTVWALWSVKKEDAAELHRRLRRYDGQAKDLPRGEMATLAARCALAVRHLTADEEWGGVVWPLLERLSERRTLRKGRTELHALTEPLSLRRAPAGVYGRPVSDYAQDAVYRAARGHASTTNAAIGALSIAADRERLLDLIVEIAQMTSR